jgi:ankyrin repeat protein
MTALHVAITDRFNKDGKTGKSRLMTGKQKYPMVEFLLRYGADVNATCKVLSLYALPSIATLLLLTKQCSTRSIF